MVAIIAAATIAITSIISPVATAGTTAPTLETQEIRGLHEQHGRASLADVRGSGTDRVVKNDHGMYTIKCQVVQLGSGLNIVGHVYGNHKDKVNMAKKDAGQYVPKFGPGHNKRHCTTVKKYRPSGAYRLSGEVI